MMSNNHLSLSFHQFSHFCRHVIPNIRSYYGKITLVAIISLLIVIFFVLLLHAYARWFLGQAHYRRRRSVSISHVLNNPTLLHHHHIQQTQFIYDDTHTGFLTDGLDISIIASLPLFVYRSVEYKNGLECAICLSTFEDEDNGRQLPKCHHAFHVECIDMWFQSHSSCPICRAPVKSGPSMEVHTLSNNDQEPAVIDSPETVIIEELTMEEVLIEMPPPPPPPPPPFSMGGTLQRNMSEPKKMRAEGNTIIIDHQV